MGKMLDPRKREKIAAAIAGGDRTHANIAKEYGVAAETVRRISEAVTVRGRVRRTLENPKKRIILESDFLDLAGDALDHARSMLPKASAAQAAVIAGVAVDKAQVLGGHATANLAIVAEHRHTLPQLGDLLRAAVEAAAKRAAAPHQMEGGGGKKIPAHRDRWAGV